MVVRSLLGGLGLLTVLVTVVILGVLGTRALSSTDTAGPAATAHGGASPASDSDATAGPTEHEDAQPPGIEAARAVQCDVDRQTVETAARTYEAMRGSLPDRQEALVAAGLLAETVVYVDLGVVDDQLVVVGTGPCAP